MGFWSVYFFLCHGFNGLDYLLISRLADWEISRLTSWLTASVGFWDGCGKDLVPNGNKGLGGRGFYPYLVPSGTKGSAKIRASLAQKRPS